MAYANNLSRLDWNPSGSNFNPIGSDLIPIGSNLGLIGSDLTLIPPIPSRRHSSAKQWSGGSEGCLWVDVQNTAKEKTAPNVLHSEPFFPFLIDFQPVRLFPLTQLFIGGRDKGNHHTRI